MIAPANSTSTIEPEAPTKPLLILIIVGFAAAITGAAADILKLHAPLLPSRMIFWNTPNVYIYFFFVVRGPYFLCLLLLAVRNARVKSLAMGAGFGLATLDMLAEGFTLLFLLPEISWFKPPVPQILGSVLLSFIGNLLVAFGSARYLWKSTTPKLPFLAAGLAAVVYVLVVFQLEEAGFHKFSAALEAIDRESQSAAETVRAVSWCAILHRATDGEYPSSLAAMDSGISCGQTWSLPRIPDYELTFTPSHDASGRIAGFTVRAKAPPSSLRFRKDAESNDSGDVYLESQEPGRRKQLRFQSGAAMIGLLHDCITGFAEDNPASGFPAQLRGVNDCPILPDSEWISENSFMLGGYLISYSPEAKNRSGKIATFRLEARCREYGKSCLVSLYSDEGDDIRRTAEDRPATSQDPIVAK